MQVLLMGSSNFAIDIIKFQSTTEHIVSYITTDNRIDENLHSLVDSVIHAYRARMAQLMNGYKRTSLVLI